MKFHLADLLDTGRRDTSHKRRISYWKMFSHFQNIVMLFVRGNFSYNYELWIDASVLKERQFIRESEKCHSLVNEK